MIVWRWRYVVTVRSCVRAIFTVHFTHTNTHARTIFMSLMDKADKMWARMTRSAIWLGSWKHTSHYTMIFLSVFHELNWMRSIRDRVGVGTLDVCRLGVSVGSTLARLAIKMIFYGEFIFSLFDSHTLSSTFFSSILFMCFMRTPG